MYLGLAVALATWYNKEDIPADLHISSICCYKNQDGHWSIYCSGHRDCG